MPMESPPSGPTVHLSWGKPYDFPDKGSMEVSFRVKRREECLNKDGSKRYEICLELLEISEIEEESGPSAPASNYDEAGQALDKLRAESEGEED